MASPTQDGENAGSCGIHAGFTLRPLVPLGSMAPMLLRPGFARCVPGRYFPDG